MIITGGPVDLPVSAFGFRPHPGQAKMIRSNVSRILACCGRGWGKSVASDLKAIKTALKPENANRFGALLAPTYKQLTRIHEANLTFAFDSFLRTTGINLVKKYVKSEKRWELINGAEIWLLSYERHENLRGYTLAWAGVDEITSTTDEDKIMGVLEPALRGGGSNEVWHTATPRGLRGVVKQYVDAVRDGDERYQVIHGTSYDSPFLDSKQINLLKSTMGRSQVREEIYASLLKPGNLVFAEFNLAKHLVDWTYDSSHPYSIWCDWGDSHPAYLLVQHVNVMGREVNIICKEYVEDEIPWEQSKTLLKQWVKDANREPEMVVGDRAVKQMMSWASWAFPSARIRKMESKDQQNIWTGVQLLKGFLDPGDGGTPKLMIARHLAANKNPRGIVQALSQIQREMRDGSPIDAVRKDNVTDHVIDACRMGVVARSTNTDYFVVNNRK